jgi:hypothetical protein
MKVVGLAGRYRTMARKILPRKRPRMTIPKGTSCINRRCGKEGCKRIFNSWKEMEQHDNYMHQRILFEVRLCIKR